MSSRTTRSSARLAAQSAAAAAGPGPPEPSEQIPRPNPRKRKASNLRQPNPDTEETPSKATPPHRIKRPRRSVGVKEEPASPRLQPGGMAKPGSSSVSPTEDSSRSRQAPDATKKKSGRGKKTSAEQNKTETSSASRRPKARSISKDHGSQREIPKDGLEANTSSMNRGPSTSDPSNTDNDSSPKGLDDDLDTDDPFASGFLRGPSSFSSAVRALGIGSGTGARLRGMLEKLKQTDDPSVQLIMLQDLAQTLLMAQEDSLQGQIPCDSFVKELVNLMQNNTFGVEIPMMACRCIANLMEVLPPSIANVVYGNTVPVLCQKLLEPEFLDVVEQALSTLEKISVEFPSSIVREGGLNGCLQFLDFFPIAVQRTAVTTAANCCRNISIDSYSTVCDVMPNLLNVLSSNDHGVMEQASLCVSRLVESFKYEHEKLESIVSTDLLKAIRRLLLPSAVNMIGPNIHTQFLRVLSITARASPKLAAELIKMGIVDTLYQILTGVSPPADLEDAASSIDSVLIMQSLIHKPRDQVFETLTVICELLPGIQQPKSPGSDRLSGAAVAMTEEIYMASRVQGDVANAKRLEMLQTNTKDLTRFAVIMFPTLTDAYSSTVNLSVRQKVLTAQLKMLSNVDVEILELALRPMQYASFLASVLSQQDHTSLVVPALEAAEFLLVRMESIYSYQFHREGVIAEIKRLSERPYNNGALVAKMTEAVQGSQNARDNIPGGTPVAGAGKDNPHIANYHAARLEPLEDGEEDEEDGGEHEDDEDDDGDDFDGMEDGSGEPEDLSPSSNDSSDSERKFSERHAIPDLQDLITIRAKHFLDTYQGPKTKEMGDKAAAILQELQVLAKEIEKCHPTKGSSAALKLFTRLCRYFSIDEAENVTSAELLRAEIAGSLLESLNCENVKARANARTAFLQAFMNPLSHLNSRKSSTSNLATPFSVLVHKLQDVLSRAEHFEVITINQNAMEINRSSASSMLSKQMRLRLVPEEQADASKHRNRDVTISIHAIANFKALDDYLRPRLSLSDRSFADGTPKSSKHREEYLTNLAGALGAGSSSSGQNPTDKPASKPTDPTTPQAPANPISSARSTRQSSRIKGSSSEGKEKPKLSRPSSRRKEASEKSLPALQAGTDTHSQSQSQAQLECADEKVYSDDDDETMDEVSALEAIVDDLEDGLETEPLPDPTAVNMEVASTGKVTARKEDGSRISTPSQSSTTPLQSLSQHHIRHLLAAGMGSSMSSRYMSYAAAMQSVPQDWHLEFSVEGKSVPSGMTIYRAIQEYCTSSTDPVRRNIWSACHTVKFKRVPGPPPAGSNTLNAAELYPDDEVDGMPTSLQENPVTSKILSLLNILHELNANLDDVLEEGSGTNVRLSPEPLASFVNTKLTAKLNRQLEEPLIVASSCLPKWSQDLPKFYPFLFPFETRHLFLQSTSFGYSRSMTRWHGVQAVEDTRRERHRDDRPFMGRLQRQKVRISRNRILDSAEKVLELYGSSPSMLEVEYFEEVGTGLGPTLEFFSTVSKEFSKKKLKLWRHDNASESDEYAFGKLGLFPAPMSDKYAGTEAGKKTLNHFKMLGRFIARSMLDSRIIDVSLNPTFFRIGNTPSTVPLSLGAVKTVDTHLARSLKMLKQFAQEKKRIQEDTRCSAIRKSTALKEIRVNGVQIEDLSLDFTLPGYPTIELIENGANTNVTVYNVEEYIDKVVDMTLGSGVQRQVDAFRAGFSQAFPYSALRAFTPAELVMLFGRVEEDWTLETLLDSIKADHGYNMDSRCVRDLLQVMSELTMAQRRDFLQFITGSPKLPIGGFKALTPMFTVVRKPAEPPYTSDDFLISVMTCANYVKLPEYSSIDVLRKRLFTAIEEGQGAFHLS